MRQLTEQEAKAFFDEGVWKTMDMRQRAEFQLWQDRLCMPFDKFQEAVEKTLGRPVWTHEFGLNRDGLKMELCGEIQAPSFEEIFSLIPPEKLIVVQMPDPSPTPSPGGEEGAKPWRRKQ